ncbi:MAG: acetylxylan esterase [Armatimonadetes bacterium]|nr:acetylxylan esterase [Anaerolineae bacterium]
MAYLDLPLEDLFAYTPLVTEPADFDAFWAATLAEARQYPLKAVFTPVDNGLRLVETYDVTFSGYGGQRIKAWYTRPANFSGALPCVVEYLGYGGGRNLPHEWLLWATAGYAHLVMDTRGQGSVWSPGDTPDMPDGANPSFPGFMTQGILSPATYYYRRVFTDAVRAVEAARSRADVDASRIALSGGSQGGGMSIAAGALVGDVALVLPDVPFLCHFTRAMTMTDAFPYQELRQYLKVHRTREAQALHTLAYFDGVNFAARLRAPSLFSVALMDEVCPPSTVFAAYNRVSAPKEINVYPYNGHEGGGSEQTRAKLAFVRAVWGDVTQA